ncbi:hypothetical protein [Nitrosospira sp. NpAV]|uniref:hypothetical protein n=1 Tax=Nitrosospira sp. NpAV TaxID=58133 RepID=UPI0005A056F5|nr:hypothetical protein [Nitrosospira sp. NpAV]KIO49611.1 hypothetical protein SQ11_05680 [Nitrosospira sp. NpAV]
MAKALTLCAVGLVVVALLWLWHVSQLQPLPQVSVSTPAETAPEVEDAPKVPVVTKAPIRVYSGGKVLKKKLNLPSAVAEDPAREIIASSQAKADDHPQTITTVINTTTGDSETYIRRDPLPWLAWDTSGEVGVYAGIKNGQQAVRLQARQGIVQVKALHLGVMGSIDQAAGGASTLSGTDYFVGVGAWVKW